MAKHDLQFEDFAPDVHASGDLEYIELPIATRVFLFVAITALVIGSIIIGRVVFLNIARGAFYNSRSSANVNLEVALPAYRGLITDRFGEVLAKNAETFSVFVNSANFLKDRSTLEVNLEKLSEALGVPAEELRIIIEQADLEQKTSVALMRNISSEMAIAVRGLALTAVEIENDYRREYVDGPIFSHLIGYTGVSEKGNAIIGKTGLEVAHDEDLRGLDGTHVYHRDVKGQMLDDRISAEPIAGKTLETTIDADFQRYFYNRLASGLHSLGITAGVGIALNPQTNEILALVSLPSFDNNVFVTANMSQERTALFNDARRPLFNRALQGNYNPGSTIKPLVALAALKEKVVDPTYQIYSPGYIDIPNPYVPDKPSRFLDWRPQGWVDVRSALARSSNVYFYEVGGGFEGLKGLGIARLKKYWQQFGLGVKTGIDLSFESSGFLPDPIEKEARTGQPWRIGDTYHVSIGQGDLLVSPLQLVNFIGSIANGGKLYTPTLVRRLTDTDGKFVPAQESPKLIFDYSSWQVELSEVRAGMRDAVTKDYGTAYKLSDLPFSIAAKTGSAQIENNAKTNAFFVGYAPAASAAADKPAENAQIAILVLVENAKEGSLNAIPIAKDVLSWYYSNRIVNDRMNNDGME